MPGSELFWLRSSFEKVRVPYFAVCNDQRIFTLESVKNYPKGARLEKIVIGEEPAIVAAGQVDGIGEVAVDTHIGFPAKISKPRESFPICLNDLPGIVGRSAIQDDDLYLIVRLQDDAFQSLANEGAAIPG